MTLAPLLLRGDARALPLPDASVDLIVTSPPYFALRSYTDGGEHYAGQIGSEATPQEFIAALAECTREWMRVLKPSGSMFVNLGDKYASYEGNRGDGQQQKNAQGRPRIRGGAGLTGGGFVRSKSLMMLPERYRIACVDDLGLIARAVIIWAKPNGLPESVTDRVRRSHEDWVHLTKAPRYFAAVDEIREAYAPGTAKRYATGYNGTTVAAERLTVNVDYSAATYGENPLGKLPGSVWEIATQPLTVPKELGVDHFAAFPMEWPRRIILGWSPAGICTECGEGRRPVVDRVRTFDGQPAGTGSGGIFADTKSVSRNVGVGNWRFGAETTITGYACACPESTAPTRPAVVLDPFGGTGTTALVASVLGRIGISVDLSGDYCRLAQWRTNDAKQIERAGRPSKPRIPASTVDTSLGQPVASHVMTTNAEEIGKIREWNAQARGRVLAAAGLMSNQGNSPAALAELLRHAMMELVEVWREEANALEASTKRGRQGTAKSLRDAATRLAGFAVQLSKDVDSAPEPPVDRHDQRITDADGNVRNGDGTIIEAGPALRARFAADTKYAKSLAALGPNNATRSIYENAVGMGPQFPGEWGYIEAEHGRPRPPCFECITDDEDPLVWCDCGNDEVCKGPCKRRAHAPSFHVPGPDEGYYPIDEPPVRTEQILDDLKKAMPNVHASPTPIQLIDNPFTSPQAPGVYRAPVEAIPYGRLPALSTHLLAQFPRGHVSHSYVSSYESCSLSAMLADASKAKAIGPRRPSWSLIGGSAFHAAVEAIERGVLAGETPDADWESHLDVQIKTTIEELTGTPYGDPSTWHVANGGREGFDWWRIEGAAMLARYVDHHDAAWRERYKILTIKGVPVIEYPYSMTVRTLDGSTGITAEGFIDQAWVDQQSGTVTVTDMKSGRSEPGSTFQLGEYAHALAMEINDAKFGGRYWLARKGIYTDLVDVLAAHPLEELQFRYGATMRGTQAGVFVPNVTNLCVSCGVRDYCPAGAR